MRLHCFQLCHCHKPALAVAATNLRKLSTRLEQGSQRCYYYNVKSSLVKSRRTIAHSDPMVVMAQILTTFLVISCTTAILKLSFYYCSFNIAVLLPLSFVSLLHELQCHHTVHYSWLSSHADSDYEKIHILKSIIVYGF